MYFNDEVFTCVEYCDEDDFFDLFESWGFMDVGDMPFIPDMKRNAYYANIPIAFDIETSSTIIDEKVAFMYLWQMSFNGHPVYGRTWESWERFITYIVDKFCIDDDFRLAIYVHNLAYEFQFIRKFFAWDLVFARQRRKPIFARCGSLEFRCSYMLSNASLAFVGSKLHKYKIDKLVGDLDYDLVRHSETPLSNEELMYGRNDVLVVTSYVQELIEDEGDITKIPYTSTGFVRNEYRQACFEYGAEYKTLMKSLQIPHPDFYSQLKRAFMGGFTHASALHVNQILDKVESRDITSDYPTVMCSEREFPMETFRYVGNIMLPKLFYEYINNYCCIFDIEFSQLKPKALQENWLSYSKCITSDDVVRNNGRIVSASKVYTTLTNIDFQIISKFYQWKSIKIGSMWIATKGYLPKPIIETTLKLYGQKTKLKGIKSEETAYMKSKNRLNAGYGMMVTDIAGDLFEYQGETWYEAYASLQDTVAQYNRDHNRFLYYPWGLWVTALARQRLANAILELGYDYVYADTDSVKFLVSDKYNNHAEYFETDDMQVQIKLRKMCAYYNFPISITSPEDMNGVNHPLGIWEIDARYDLFKTCGAKRYIYTTKNDDGTSKLSLTVSGLRKEPAIEYLILKYSTAWRAIMDTFGEGFSIPAGYTGKMLLTYIDDEKTFAVEDYNGDELLVNAPSAVHMEAEGYNMSITEEYLRYIQKISRMDLK